VDPRLAELYSRLLAVLRHPAVRDGHWLLLNCNRAWADNDSADNFIAFEWLRAQHERLCVVVNHAQREGQCFVQMAMPWLAGRSVRFKDLISAACYDRDGSDLLNRGLYIDVPAWGCHVFEMQFAP
jgi:hypothetical protein